ncbi:MAG: ferritin-like domain-containing protein [Rhodococcus sp. (in: high G+C Gram-positive bacteria)]|uniref:ferritin-like domain-containing protein n=1 Tax=Rhodococcus TaxID=1827 RepID=UPI001E523AA7|nr:MULTISPECIES: ferritin-like domain-containing protein [Rhodococcus erythropolis group]MCD2107104.1 ferritin-like domain-containing protein [Rhodococcus qingshengii]MCZ4526533.1 ferritin-like domain-containing protein [Rhodococcus erythropolis]MDZ7917176.1 ferritin-like domain-containing protein [Rhodococcus sp. (in: high G+C Gram-positive bacteria)]
MSNSETTSALITQLRILLGLTHAEIQVAETRVAQARTEAVRRELTENAENGRERASSIEATIRDLGGVPELIGPFIGRATAGMKAMVEQAQPFDEAILGDLGLEHQLLDRSRYLKALATAGGDQTVATLADRLITAHSATVDWLTTVLAEEALGGPAALRRTPMQAATGAAIRLVNVPVSWSTRSLDRAIDAVRTSPPVLGELISWGAYAGDVTVKTLSASRDAAIATAEKVTRREGADGAADVFRSVRKSSGLLEPTELPIEDFDELNVTQAVSAVKELTEAAQVRDIVAYEEAHKNRHGVVSAAQARLAAIAQEVVGIN